MIVSYMHNQVFQNNVNVGNREQEQVKERRMGK